MNYSFVFIYYGKNKMCIVYKLNIHVDYSIKFDCSARYYTDGLEKIVKFCSITRTN